MANDCSRSPTLHRAVQLQQTVQALRRAKVPDSVVKEVVEEEEIQEMFIGYVRIVYRTATQTLVSIRGEFNYGGWEHEIVVSFPPNLPQFLEQLIRAQNHPHMRVEIYSTMKAAARIINGVNTYWDYGLPPIANMPSFEVATSEQGSD